MRCLRLCLLFVMCFSVTAAMPPEQVETRPGLPNSLAPTDIDFQTYIDANQILMFVTNQGSFAYDNGAMFGKADGLYYPNGTNLTAIYAAGLWLGGKIGGDLRVSLAEYSHTYVPGPMAGCTFQDDRDEFKVYKIFRDLQESGFYDDPRPACCDQEQEQWDDYHNWPVIDGAPVDGAGDPLIIGDQTLWCVFNDAAPWVHVNSAGSSEGLGVEVQHTAFACDLPGPLGNTVFMKYILINKGCEDIENMYMSFWADPDLGAVDDDFVGSDTTLNLGYCYNATSGDGNYGDDPPAVGFDVLQGPIVPAPGHTALYLGEWQPGFRNLPMTTFIKYINGTDPDNAQETYWYMQGLDAKNSGAEVTNPITGEVTSYMFDGDPTTGAGWLDSNPSDRRYMLSFGPFDMEPEDTQEVWMAVIVGQGGDHLSSVSELKGTSVAIQRIFEDQYQIPERLPICEARVTTQPTALHRPSLDKTAWIPPEPDFIPYSLQINLTYSESAELAIGDSARVYVDADGNGFIDQDEQCPAAVTAIGGTFARNVTVCAIPEEELTQNSTRVAIYAIASKTIVDDNRKPVDYLHAYVPALYEGEWHNLAAGEQVPGVYYLEVNYPNPFNATTRISYALAETGPVTLTVHDILGRQIRTLVDELKPAGRHEAIWDSADMHGNAVASGIYFYKLAAGGFVEMKKMVLMK